MNAFVALEVAVDKRVNLTLYCTLYVISPPAVDREPSSSSYNVSSGTFYSCVSQITIGKCTMFKTDRAVFVGIKMHVVLLPYTCGQ